MFFSNCCWISRSFVVVVVVVEKKTKLSVNTNCFFSFIYSVYITSFIQLICSYVIQWCYAQIMFLFPSSFFSLFHLDYILDPSFLPPPSLTFSPLYICFFLFVGLQMKWDIGIIFFSWIIELLKNSSLSVAPPLII